METNGEWCEGVFITTTAMLLRAFAEGVGEMGFGDAEFSESGIQ